MPQGVSPFFGSNLFNSLGVGAAIFLVHTAKGTGPLDQSIDGLVLAGMVFVSLLAALVMVRDRVPRWVGVALLVLYGALLWRIAITAIV